nr:hypothetical protein [Rhodococcus sp. 06-418-1B]
MAPEESQTRQTDEADVPRLRSLGPTYEAALHGRHVKVLLEVLTDTADNPAKNIALAGHYGSGKSSVVLGLQAELDQKKVSWINLSLSSLGIHENSQSRIQADGAPTPLTNLIQKEIVKQLLYRKAPADMPGSRYFRIDSFRPWPAIAWAAIAGITVIVTSVLLGMVKRVKNTAPESLTSNYEWSPWAITCAIGIFVGIAWFFGLRALQNHVRVESVSAGGAAVSLSAKDNSYFDEYLDEIVYFFQKTKTKVAIFEDLDRFEDPHIFETLRELNTVLNNSEQVTSRPVKFVYAVRDSIFEILRLDSGTASEISGASASALESNPSANRTKFFDLVVPMVPFITHRSARDLLEAEFTGQRQTPSPNLVRLVGMHLTDMRLIRNIRNEFEIYRASILGENGLAGLTVDKLFAMMVYKNLHLNDFEAIRLGTSNIDAAYSQFREIIHYQSEYQTMRSKNALDLLDSDASWTRRAEAAGQRLQSTLSLVARASWGTSDFVVRIDSRDFATSDLTSAEFWKTLNSTPTQLQLIRPGYGRATILSAEDLTALAGDEAGGLTEAIAGDRATLERTSRSALSTKSYVSKATMAQMIARTDLVKPTNDGHSQNLDEIVRDLVSPLAHSLIRSGYIDENFTLYCSDYHDVAISTSAMNFILHFVQPDRADHHFSFDQSTSIESVYNEMGSRFLASESVFNIDVFDYFLSTHTQRLDLALEKLLTRIESDSRFFDIYLAEGTEAISLVELVAATWNGIFVHLVERLELDQDRLVQFAGAALGSSRQEVDYGSTTEVANFIGDNYSKMGVFIDVVSESEAVKVVEITRRLGARIGDLRPLHSTQRSAVIDAHLYPVTRTNLVAAVGDQLGLALDLLENNDPVYRHVLENIADYLAVLAPNEPTVTAPDRFTSLLNDVAESHQSAVASVAERATSECVVVNIMELEPAAWHAVVAAGRLLPSIRNVYSYVETFAITSELSRYLNGNTLIDPEEVEEQDQISLAVEFINAADLGVDVTIRLLRQLTLPRHLDPAQFTNEGLILVPALLEAEIIPDAAETYSTISEQPFSLKDDYFAASSNLALYACDLPLTSDDLTNLIRSRRVPSAVKRAITGNVEFVRIRLSRQSAIEICKWSGKGNLISIDLLILLVEAGAPANLVLPLLVPHLADIDTDALDHILQGLGETYEPLTRLGTHRPRLNEHDGTIELLTELKRRDRVSSFGDVRFGAGIRVYMRR